MVRRIDKPIMVGLSCGFLFFLLLLIYPSVPDSSLRVAMFTFAYPAVWLWNAGAKMLILHWLDHPFPESPYREIFETIVTGVAWYLIARFVQRALRMAKATE
jgi:hypothetical protein